MKTHRLLCAAAVLALLSACGMGSDNAPSAKQISAAMEAGDLAGARRMIALAHAGGANSGGEAAEIRVLAARLALARGDAIGATTNLDAAQQAGADAAALLPLRAEALARQGKFEQAEKAAKQSGDAAVTAHVAGLKHWADNEPWEAREALETAFAATPDNTRLALDVARARTELGLFPEARAAIARVAKAQPKNMLAPLMLGMVEMQAREFDAAGTAYAAALKIAPSSVDALLGQAQALYANADYAGAEKSIIALPRDVAMRPEIQMLAGKIAVQKKDLVNARRHFANAGAQVENDVEAQFLLAAVHAEGGRHHKAVQLLETAVAARPDLPEYHAALIRAYRATGDEAAALRKLAQVPEGLRDAKELRGL